VRRCRVHLENIPGSPYSQSAKHNLPKREREGDEDYDIRTWKDHCTVNADGQVCIPAMAFKQAIDTAAYKLGEKVPGRRGSTYRNFFSSGVLCDHDVPIANGRTLTKDNAEMVIISANPSGMRGGGKRVPRRYPVFAKWHGVAEFIIVDDIITKEVFERHVRASGIVVGIGRFRAENGGMNGRFRAVSFEWEEVSFDA
jgi:hypothetical protein